MIKITTAAFALEIDPARGFWTLSGENGLMRSRMSISFSRGGRTFQSTSDAWRLREASEETLAGPVHGPVEQISLEGQLDPHGLRVEIGFVLAQERPLFFWKLKIYNQGRAPVFFEAIEMLNAGKPADSRFEMPGPADRAAFFSNGWQSWSDTRAYGVRDQYRGSRLGWLEGAMWYNPSTPRPLGAGHFGADFFGVIGNRETRRGWLLGFLSQKLHFGSLEATLQAGQAIRMWANGDGARLDPGAAVETDWAACAAIALDTADPWDDYLQAVARENQIAPAGQTPVGWCSWYQFYTKVTAAQILDNLKSSVNVSAQVPLDLVQIDDGFESQVGDWFAFRSTFPDGVAPLARAIRESGKTPGLWLAPFIVHPRAKLVRDHPDWILRGSRGRPVYAGFVWDAFTTALDLTHPGAMEYACRVVSTAAHEWGFPYLKLDFLYAAALPGRRHDPTQNRAQTLRTGLENLREAVGNETTLLGCGVPLGPALGLFDALRIGTDVSGEWTPQYHQVKAFFSREPNMPSARNALQNTLTRAGLHRQWWINDPDCLLVRSECALSLAEIQTMATVMALTGGSLLLSDNLPGLTADRLRLAANLLPPIGRRAAVLDWFDSAQPRRLRVDLAGAAGDWTLIAWINWEDEARQVSLELTDFRLDDKSDYFARSYWSGETMLVSGGKIHPLDVAGHGVILLAFRKTSPGQAQYLGSGLHISQGLEVTAWEPAGDCVRIGWNLPRSAGGDVAFRLPRAPREARMNGEPVKFEAKGNGVYRCSVAFDRSAEMEVWMGEG